MFIIGSLLWPVIFASQFSAYETALKYLNGYGHYVVQFIVPQVLTDSQMNDIGEFIAKIERSAIIDSRFPISILDFRHLKVRKYRRSDGGLQHASRG